MTDRERLIEIIEQVRQEAAGHGGSMNGGYAAWYADKLLAAGVAPVQGWIPVTERLPEICENVIVYVVYHSSRHVTVIRSVVPAYYTEDGFWMYGNGIRLQNVTHWMPLPEEPKEEHNG